MNGVLAAYLRRRIATQTLGLLLVLTALMQLLELLDVTNETLDRQLGIAGLLRYALLRTPAELVLALPLAALLGAMSALYAMARRHEITAMRGAGVSLRRLWLFLLPVPLIFGAFQFALSQIAVPRAEAALKRWWEASAPHEQRPLQWVRTRAGPLSFAATSADGRVLSGVQLYLAGADGQLGQRLQAREARWESGQWRFVDVDSLELHDDRLQRTRLPEQHWSLNLSPDDVLRLDIVQPQLSSIILADLIAGERAGTQPRSYYQTVFFRSYTAPLAALIMLLLALPAARLDPRSGGGRALLTALGLGLLYLLCDGICAALGTGGRMAPLAATLSTPLAFAALGYWRLSRYDRT